VTLEHKLALHSIVVVIHGGMYIVFFLIYIIHLTSYE